MATPIEWTPRGEKDLQIAWQRATVSGWNVAKAEEPGRETFVLLYRFGFPGLNLLVRPDQTDAAVRRWVAVLGVGASLRTRRATKQARKLQWKRGPRLVGRARGVCAKGAVFADLLQGQCAWCKRPVLVDLCRLHERCVDRAIARGEIPW